MGQVTICSEVGGRVLTADVPAGGIPIIRSWRWALTGETGSDRQITDQAGRFHFPAVERRKPWRAMFPHEPVIRQEYHVELAGKAQLIATGRKSDYGNGVADQYRPKSAGTLSVQFDR